MGIKDLFELTTVIIHDLDRFTDENSQQMAQKYKRPNQKAGIGQKRAKLMRKTAFLRVYVQSLSYTRRGAQPVRGCWSSIVHCFAAHVAHSC